MERRLYNKKEEHTRKLMVEKGVTIQMLAEHLGVSRTAIHGRLNRGTTEPLIEAIHQIDRILEKKEDEMYSQTGTEG
jgi:predicted transcriptional regulator